jgi:hypothetical protein
MYSILNRAVDIVKLWKNPVAFHFDVIAMSGPRIAARLRRSNPSQNKPLTNILNHP